MKRIFGTMILAAALATSAGAAEIANPAPSVDQLLASTPEAKGVFVAGGAGSAQHIESGLICPATFSNFALWHLEVFNPNGTDIGCDYGLQGIDNKWAAKLTIFAVKAPDGMTVQNAFGQYSNEIRQAWPGYKLREPATNFKRDAPGMENALGEEYELTMKGQVSVSDLLVTVQNGWIIELRLSEDEANFKNGESPADTNALGAALAQAIKTVGQTAP